MISIVVVASFRRMGESEGVHSFEQGYLAARYSSLAFGSDKAPEPLNVG